MTILHGGERFGRSPLDQTRAAPAGRYAQPRHAYLNPDGKGAVTLFACDLERELALAYAEGQEAGECQMRQLLISLLGLAATVRRENTDEWMLYLAQRMNEVLADLNEPVRVEYTANGRGDIRTVPKET